MKEGNIMVKKLLLCFVLVTAVVSAAFGEADMWYDDHYSFASLKDGKADYSDARFGYVGFSIGNTGLTLTKENMSLAGSVTLSGGRYSFWNGNEMQKVSGTPQTFRLAIPTWQAIGDEAEFYPFTDTGGNLRLGLEAESGMNGVTLTWNFPDMPSLNGTYTVPNYLTTQEQMNKHVVYFEFIRSGENVTGINWRIVSASDTSTPVELDYPVNFIRIRIWNFDNERILNLNPDFYIEPGETPEGTLMFDEPIKESDIWRVYTKFYTYDEEVEKCYGWYYYTSSTQPKMYLWSHHASNAALVNGKASYNNAKFSDILFAVETENAALTESRHFTGEGRITVPGGGYTLKDSNTGTVLSNVAQDTDMTFALKIYTGATLGDSYLEYEAADTNGKYLEFADGAEANLPGKTLTWTFPAELNMNGSGTIKNFDTTAEQLVSGVPYVEVISEDGYITAVNYKIVTASDTSTAITPAYRTDFNFRIYRTEKKFGMNDSYNVGTATNKASGTYTLDTPQPLSTMKRLRVRLTSYKDSSNPITCQWNFYPASADPAPTPTPDPTPTPSALTITTTTLPSGTTGTPYTAQLASSPSGVSWSLISGNLPSGLTLSSSGTISGTPTTSGTSTFTVRATSGTQSAEKSLSITVNPPKGSVGSSGGGCEAFAGLSGLIVLAVLFRKPHHSA